MSEMVERVAKALGHYVHADDLAIEAAARAAIEAMREPTDEMCSDGSSSVDDMSACGANNIWQAMIDAALR